VARLPETGLLRRTVRYFRAAPALGYHVEELDGRSLGLDGNAEAVLADYRYDDGPGLLLLVRFAETEAARTAEAAMRQQLRPKESTSPPARGFTAADRTGRILIAVLDAPSAASAKRRLGKALKRVRGKP
jgi:hypothetical protein